MTQQNESVLSDRLSVIRSWYTAIQERDKDRPFCWDCGFDTHDPACPVGMVGDLLAEVRKWEALTNSEHELVVHHEQQVADLSARVETLTISNEELAKSREHWIRCRNDVEDAYRQRNSDLIQQNAELEAEVARLRALSAAVGDIIADVRRVRVERTDDSLAMAVAAAAVGPHIHRLVDVIADRLEEALVGSMSTGERAKETR